MPSTAAHLLLDVTLLMPQSHMAMQGLPRPMAAAGCSCLPAAAVLQVQVLQLQSSPSHGSLWCRSTAACLLLDVTLLMPQSHMAMQGMPRATMPPPPWP